MAEKRRLSLRTALAAVLAVSSLGVFAAFGRAGLDAAMAQYEYEYGKKVTLCHHPNQPPNETIRVSESAVPAHLAHGDTLGPCA